MKRSILFLLLLAACGGTDSTEPADSGTDATSTDAGKDTGTDATGDATTDAANDTGAQDAASDVALDATIPCDAMQAGSCPSGWYCDAQSCGKGLCKPSPAETTTLAAVCGCNDVTYWNANVANAQGVTVQGSGECKPGKTCGGIANLKCPTDTFCNYELASQPACGILDAAGKCWGVPKQCPQIVIGPNTRQCNALACAERCSLIKKQVTYYVDNTCPQ